MTQDELLDTTAARILPAMCESIRRKGREPNLPELACAVRTHASFTSDTAASAAWRAIRDTAKQYNACIAAVTRWQETNR